MLDCKKLETILGLPTETEFVELKVSTFIPEKVGEILSGLANSANLAEQKSGYLIFGVSDENHSLVGTAIDLKKQKVGGEDFELWINKMMNPSANISVYQLDCSSVPVWVIEIEAAVDRPISFKSQSFIRIGSHTRNIKDFPEKERAIWKNFNNKSFENEIAEAELDEHEILRKLDYSRYFELCKKDLPDGNKAIIDSLVQEGFVSVEKGTYGITNLGAILFARDITDFEHLKRKAVRVIEYGGNHRAVNSIRQKEGKLGYAVGFDGLLKYINDLLPANEEIKQAFRVEKRMYPELAIRELVANALIHQDFSERGTGPTIEIFTDRIEISNPGRPLISIDRFIDHKPKSRNESLASFMRRIGVCEELGSGIDKVIFEVEVYQLPAPLFETKDDYTLVTLFSFQKLEEMNREDRLRACYQHCALRHVSNSYMTNSTLRERFQLPSTKGATAIVSNIIAESVKAGLIKVQDKNSLAKKLAKYVPYWA